MTIHIERRPCRERFVVRMNHDGSPFDGAKFDVCVTAEIIDPTTIYVCNATSKYRGGLTELILEAIHEFEAMGFTHGLYRRNNIDKKVKLKDYFKLLLKLSTN